MTSSKPLPVGAQLVAAYPNAYMHINQVSNPTWKQLFPIIRHFTRLANMSAIHVQTPDNNTEHTVVL